MGKTIYLNFKGPQHTKRKYSNKLMWELKDFFAKHDEGYYDEKEKEGILTNYYEVKNGICLQNDIQVRQEDFICTSVLSISLEKFLNLATEDMKKDLRLELLECCNRINIELDYGHFELIDMYGISIAYKTYFNPQGGECFDGLDMLIGYPMGMVEKYGMEFDKICRKYYNRLTF